MPDRWATFDCYGTLIDWNAGIRGELERVFAGRDEEELDALLRRYHEVERELEKDGSFATTTRIRALISPRPFPAGSRSRRCARRSRRC